MKTHLWYGMIWPNYPRETWNANQTWHGVLDLFPGKNHRTSMNKLYMPLYFSVFLCWYTREDSNLEMDLFRFNVGLFQV